MSELPLEAATKDVIARYSKGNDMLASAAVALRRLKERIDTGEAGPEWDWPNYRHEYLEPHISVSWLKKQLMLAPSGATEEQVAENVAEFREQNRIAVARHRERPPVVKEEVPYVRNRPITDPPIMDWLDQAEQEPPSTPTATQQDIEFAALTRAWNCASTEVRERFLREVVGQTSSRRPAA